MNVEWCLRCELLSVMMFSCLSFCSCVCLCVRVFMRGSFCLSFCAVCQVFSSPSSLPFCFSRRRFFEKQDNEGGRMECITSFYLCMHSGFWVFYSAPFHPLFLRLFLCSCSCSLGQLVVFLLFCGPLSFLPPLIDVSGLVAVFKERMVPSVVVSFKSKEKDLGLFVCLSVCLCVALCSRMHEEGTVSAV